VLLKGLLQSQSHKLTAVGSACVCLSSQTRGASLPELFLRGLRFPFLLFSHFLPLHPPTCPLLLILLSSSPALSVPFPARQLQFPPRPTEGARDGSAAPLGRALPVRSGGRKLPEPPGWTPPRPASRARRWVSEPGEVRGRAASVLARSLSSA
jgi:hypothetical protein